MDPTSPATDAEMVYARLKESIVGGRFAPGHKLKIAELRTEFGVGAAPLREALARLIGERIVEQHSNRGFYVRTISAADARDLGRVRALLECEALRASLAVGDEAWETGLVAAYHGLRLAEERGAAPEEIEPRNRAFHDALVVSCGSPWLLDLRDQVYAQHERYRNLSRGLGKNTRDTPAEHAAIYEAALARDVEATCRLTTRHIELTTEAACKAMAAATVSRLGDRRAEAADRTVQG